MTRIAHIITRMDIGGSSDDTLLLATRMPSADFDCTLVSGLTVDPVPELVDALRQAGVSWIRIPELQRPVHALRDFQALFSLRKTIRTLRPDIVHTHSSKAGVLGRLAARLAGVPRILHTPHGHVFQGYYGPATTRFFIRLERLAARFTERIVVLTDTEAKQHLAVGIGRPEQFVRIPSGVDLARARSGAEGAPRIRQDLGLSPNTPVIGSVARLVPVKGFRHLIAAMPDLLRQCPEVHLVLAGDGEERAELQRLAGVQHVGGRVHFLGFRLDAAAVTAAFDVFVLPSLNEGQGRVLVTAMALGVPIVTSRVGGVPEVVEHERHGLLVPPANPQALSQAIGTLLRDRGLAAAFGNAGRRQASQFSLELMLRRHEEMYLRPPR